MLSIKICGQCLHVSQQSINQYNHTVCTTMQLYNQLTNKPSDLPKILKARFEKYSISTVHRNCLPVQTASCVFRHKNKFCAEKPTCPDLEGRGETIASKVGNRIWCE